MSKLYLLLLILGIAVFESCKKEEPVSPASSGYNRYSIIGKWSCVYTARRTDTSGVTLSSWDTTMANNFHNYYNFTTDSTYEYFSNNVLYDYGSYRIDPDSSQLILRPNTIWPTVIQFERSSYFEFWMRVNHINQYSPTTISTTYNTSKFRKF